MMIIRSLGRKVYTFNEFIIFILIAYRSKTIVLTIKQIMATKQTSFVYKSHDVWMGHEPLAYRVRLRGKRSDQN